MTLKEMATQALEEMESALHQIREEGLEQVLDEIVQARRIALYGVGREGLMMRALAMRLYHSGLDAHVVGDMSTPPLAEGDLLLVSAGPGGFSTVSALIGVAQQAGARTVCFTSVPSGASASQCDVVLELPAQTMANDQNGPSSILPMGSLYEGVQYVAYELLILRLRERIKESPESMRARHTNLE